MRIKLYKARFLTCMTLDKNTPYQECYYACIRNEKVKIEYFNFFQKLIAKTIPIEEPAVKEDIGNEKADFKNVKEYKKDYYRRYNAYCSKVDNELCKIENR